MLHRTLGDFSEVETLAEKYPRVTWIIAHSAMSFEVADGAMEVVRKYSNVLLDITYTSVPGGIIDYMADGVGADRIVYGSDLPMRDPRPQFGWVVYSRLPVEDKQKILGGNARALLQRIRARRH